jgi:hypothetical protein
MMRAILLLLCAGCAFAGSGVPVFFVPNQGQAPPAVRFMAKGSGLTAYFLPGEIDLRLHDARLRVRFEGANRQAQPEGANPLKGRANFLVGDSSQWRRDLPTFAAIRYRNLYPGIDMIYGGNGLSLKSEFVIAPGADPTRIRIRYSGARPIIQPDGSLSIAVKGQKLSEAAPYIYQQHAGSRIVVEGQYALSADGAVSFSLGDYDRSLPLIIDPLLSYSITIGATAFNAATAIAVDSSGAAYIAGYTDSDALPTANPAQNFNSGSVAAFVAKLTPLGTAMEYCTYMGGSDDDRAFGIAVDSTGAAYVTGTATSPNFPIRNAEQSTLAGSRDAFLFKLNPMGNMLVFSTFLGGSGSETAYAVALDASNNSYLVGDTTSLNFPAGGYKSNNQGGQDAFVAKISASGGQLLFATYLGGAGSDHAGAVAVDPTGSVYVTGSTTSLNFPVSNAFQSTIAGPCSAYLARLSADGASLIYSTYLGGSGCTMAYPETGQGIALDAHQNAYVAGVTSSGDFPLLNAVQPQLEGFTDAFVAKFNSAGTLLFSTYMGGSGVDVGNGIALDASGGIYVVGYTYSDDFPVTDGAAQVALGGQCDAFLFKLTPAGDTLLYATYLGGSNSDTASGVAVDTSGNVYLAGWTLSSNFLVVVN